MDFKNGIIDATLTASRLLASNGSKRLASVANLADWIAGTAGRVTVTDDGDGSVTLDVIVSGGGDHGGLTGLSDDDHAQYLLAAGSRAGASSQAQQFTNGIITPSIRPSSDATNAVVITAANGDPLLTVDSVNDTIGVSALRAQATAGQNVLGLKDSAGLDSVLVDDKGNLLTAGIKWTSRTYPADNTWNSVCYGNGLFVAVASGGTGNRVMVSPDGVNWTVRSGAGDYSWISVCYGNGLFVALSSALRVMTSPDGINWVATLLPSSNATWYSICYGNGVFVGVGFANGSSSVMVSRDGLNWTYYHNISENNTWKTVCFGNGLFVALASSYAYVSTIATSPDGITWTARTCPLVSLQWNGICYGHGLFVAVAGSGLTSRIMTSPDGITWTSRTSDVTNTWKSICYGNGLFVAVASAGMTNRVCTSPDGITWTFRSSSASNAWNSVCYGNGLFVAVASSGTGTRVMTSGYKDPDLPMPQPLLGLIVNENGSPDADFRAESDTEENMLFVDASTDKAYIGGITNGVQIDKGGHVTLNGTATYFDDILQTLIGNRLESPSSDIWQDSAEGTIVFSTGADLDDYVIMNVQMKHSRKLGLMFSPIFTGFRNPQRFQTG